jgi:hypothetical protein
MPLPAIQRRSMPVQVRQTPFRARQMPVSGTKWRQISFKVHESAVHVVQRVFNRGAAFDLMILIAAS